MGQLGDNTDMVVTANIATEGKKTLTKELGKYGDKFNRINLFVMYSITHFDIVDQAIDNKVYEEACVIYGGSTWDIRQAGVIDRYCAS
ncbi:MAG TPA: major capsid protein [Arsenophonus sp.]